MLPLLILSYSFLEMVLFLFFMLVPYFPMFCSATLVWFKNRFFYKLFFFLCLYADVFKCRVFAFDVLSNVCLQCLIHTVPLAFWHNGAMIEYPSTGYCSPQQRSSLSQKKLQVEKAQFEYQYCPPNLILLTKRKKWNSIIIIMDDMCSRKRDWYVYKS